MPTHAFPKPHNDAWKYVLWLCLGCEPSSSPMNEVAQEFNAALPDPSVAAAEPDRTANGGGESPAEDRSALFVDGVAVNEELDTQAQADEDADQFRESLTVSKYSLGQALRRGDIDAVVEVEAVALGTRDVVIGGVAERSNEFLLRPRRTFAGPKIKAEMRVSSAAGACGDQNFTAGGVYLVGVTGDKGEPRVNRMVMPLQVPTDNDSVVIQQALEGLADIRG